MTFMHSLNLDQFGSTAECGGQQLPPSDGDCHTPLPCEVRKAKNTTPRACCPTPGARVKRTSGIGCNGASPGPRLLLFCRRRSRPRLPQTPREWPQAFTKVFGI